MWHQNKQGCKGALHACTHLKKVIRKPKPAGRTHQFCWYRASKTADSFGKLIYLTKGVHAPTNIIIIM